MADIAHPLDDLTVVVVSFWSGDLLTRCVESVVFHAPGAEVIVVDNSRMDGWAVSNDGRWPNVMVVDAGGNLGFAAGANLGASHSQRAYLLFLNPDAMLTPGAALQLCDELRRRPAVGVCGPAIMQEASDLLELGATIDRIGHPTGLFEPARPLFVTGSSLMTRRDLFETLGGFDVRYFMFVEDVEYCWRVLLCGYDVCVVGDARVRHVGGASAPGGYPTQEGVRTSTFRVGLRERNTLAMLLACYAAPSLVVVVPVYLVQSLVTALALLMMGNVRTSGEVLRGLYWNVQQLPQTSRRRQQVQRLRKVPDREITVRMVRGFAKLQAVRRWGLPKVDRADSGDS